MRSAFALCLRVSSELQGLLKLPPLIAPQLPFEAAPGWRSPPTCTPANRVRPLSMKARPAAALGRALAGCLVHMWMGRLFAA